MKSKEFIFEDEDENPYKSVSRIKRQVIPISHKPSKLQELCVSKGIKRGDNVFVKEGDDYQHCVFLRAGEKMIHVQNYAANRQESVDPKTVYTQEGFKYMPIIETKKKVTAKVTEEEMDRFPEYMGGYFPPFNTFGNLVVDKKDITVARCESAQFARIIAIALNQYVRKN